MKVSMIRTDTLCMIIDHQYVDELFIVTRFIICLSRIVKQTCRRADGQSATDETADLRLGSWNLSHPHT